MSNNATTERTLVQGIVVGAKEFTTGKGTQGATLYYTEDGKSIGKATTFGSRAVEVLKLAKSQEVTFIAETTTERCVSDNGTVYYKTLNNLADFL